MSKNFSAPKTQETHKRNAVKRRNRKTKLRKLALRKEIALREEARVREEEARLRKEEEEAIRIKEEEENQWKEYYTEAYHNAFETLSVLVASILEVWKTSAPTHTMRHVLFGEELKHNVGYNSHIDRSLFPGFMKSKKTRRDMMITKMTEGHAEAAAKSAAIYNFYFLYGKFYTGCGGGCVSVCVSVFVTVFVTVCVSIFVTGFFSILFPATLFGSTPCC